MRGTHSAAATADVALSWRSFRSGLFSPFFCGLFFCAGSCATAAIAAPPNQTPQPADEEPGLVIFLLEPKADEPAGGRTPISAEVPSHIDEEVVFLVDNRVVARFRAPPFRTEIDLDMALEHRFEVLVLSDGTEVGHRERTVPGIRVDDQVDLNLRQLYVSVQRGGQPVRDLRRQQFTVVDAGSKQEIVTFEGGDAAITAALLVDSSLSMGQGKLELALESAEALLGGFRELDEAAIYLFSDHVVRHVPAATKPTESLRRLLGAAPRGGSAIHDVLYRALRELEARQGRRVLVLLSDGIDVHSTLSAEQVRWATRRASAIIYWIRLGAVPGQRQVSPWRTPDEHEQQIDELTRLIEESGGRILPIAELVEARAAFASILAELRRQYIIGYYPSDRRGDGEWHSVKVRVGEPGMNVRSREGYIDG